MLEGEGPVVGDFGEAQVIDQDQLIAALAQSTDGTAQIIDSDGNTITITADQLAELGILESYEGAQVIQLQEGETLQTEDGTLYVVQDVEQEESSVAPVSHVVVPTTAPATKAPAGQMHMAYASGQSHVRTHMPQQRVGSQNHAMQQGQHTATALQREMEQMRRMMDQYRRQLNDRDAKLTQMEEKIRETSEQNVIMAHALVNTCKSQEVEVVVQGANGQPDKRHIVSVKQTGPEIVSQPMLPASSRSRASASNFSSTTTRSGAQELVLSHQCEHCPKRFAAEHHLRRHVELAHQQKRPFHCKFCKKDLFFNSEQHFQAHMRMQHKQEVETSEAAAAAALAAGGVVSQPAKTAGQDGGSAEAMYQCGACDESFTDTDALVQHISSKHLEGTTAVAAADKASEEETFFKCKICQKEFLTEVGFNKHILQHPGAVEQKEDAKKQVRFMDDESMDTSGAATVMFDCEKCERRFSTQGMLEEHKRSMHGGVEDVLFSCHICPKRFKWKENLQDHLNWHLSQMPYKCTQCSKSFSTQNRLTQHMQKQHVEKKREQMCPICDKQFYEREHLAKHLREHRDHVFPCPECDKKFTEERFLKRHLIVHTGNREHCCSVCGKVFARPENLRAHRYLHTGEKPHKCDVCGIGFTTKWSLANHVKLHSTVKAHMCDKCGRSFNQAANLALHARTHLGVKPFQCSSCNRTFSRVEHLQTHVNAHKGIRPHPCKQCDNAFYTAEHLKQHERIHRGDPPHQCATCGSAFTARAQLEKHVQQTHTSDADQQYVIVYERAGAVQEAVIVMDGLSQDATVGQLLGEPKRSNLPLDLPYIPPPREAPKSELKPLAVQSSPAVVPKSVQQRSTQPHYKSAAASARHAVPVAPPSLEPVEEAQIVEQVAPEPVDASGMEGVQFVDEHGNPVTLDERVVVLDESQLDPETLFALQQQLQGGDTGEATEAVYITEEELQALADQGLVLSYE